jgi:hypothetical protein
MISIRFWPVAALSAATLLGLAACSPASAPYEPPAPPPAPAPEAAPADDATSLAAQAAVEAIEEVHDHEEGHAGEAHVHGGGELAITREDDFLTVSLDAPLANFGLSETKVPKGAKAEKYAEGIVEPIGPTVCEETERSITGRTDGTHGAMTVSVVWRCKKIDRVEGMLVHVFDLYPAFEHIDAIYLGPDGQQVAKELTPSDTEIDFD